MRSDALLCVAALACAGCYDDAPGLRLVVNDPGLGAVKVELFLATRPAMANAIGADAARDRETRTKLRGEGYFLDGPRQGTTPMTVLDVVDGKVVWNLQADPEGPSELKIAVAVAYDGQGHVVGLAKMYDVDVPTNDTVAYILDLKEASQLAPSETKEPMGLRVWPWRKESAPATAACLSVEQSDGNSIERIWLVPEDDPDCDEVAIECDKFYWHADNTSTNGGIDDANCMSGSVETQSGSTILTECLLGARPCVDGTMPGTCIPLTQPKYCVADALCNPGACLADPTACLNAIASTAATCYLPTNKNGGPCDSSNPQQIMKLELGTFTGPCRAVEFVAWDVVANGVLPSPSYTQLNATFTISNLDPDNCKFVIDLTGTIDGLFSATTLLALDVTLNTDHLLIPLIIDSERGACTATPGCALRLESGEGLDRCQ